MKTVAGTFGTYEDCLRGEYWCWLNSSDLKSLICTFEDRCVSPSIHMYTQTFTKICHVLTGGNGLRNSLSSSWLTLVGLKETLSKTPSMLSMKREYFLKQKSVHSLSRMKLNVSGSLILFMLNLLLQEKFCISNWKHKTRVRDFNGEVQSFVLKKSLFKLHQTQILLFWVSVTVNNYYSNVHTTPVCIAQLKAKAYF